MTCDYDEREAEFTEVDARGRPTQMLCRVCHDAMVLERSERLFGFPIVDLIDEFEDVLRRERILKPEKVH